MQMVAAAYFGIVGIFMAGGMMVRATAWTLQHNSALQASVHEVWQEPAAVPSDIEIGWQHQLDALHW